LHDQKLQNAPTYFYQQYSLAKSTFLYIYPKLNFMCLDKQTEFMQEAIRLSIENVTSGNGGPFGAVIVKDGKIIARGANGVTSTNDPTAHAEVVAIRNACKELGTFQLDGCEIYTSCEPCPMCLGAIYWARPDKMYFANTKKDAADINFDDQFIYEELELPYTNRKLTTEQFMREEALEAFRLWASSQDKIEY
jgi:tRNA(Arg) A34 adenosine deaminase TadA